jgi:hypothetical protein
MTYTSVQITHINEYRAMNINYFNINIKGTRM